MTNKPGSKTIRTKANGCNKKNDYPEKGGGGGELIN